VNILKYLRRGAGTSGSSLNMDSLTYQYSRDNNGYLTNNKLNYMVSFSIAKLVKRMINASVSSD